MTQTSRVATEATTVRDHHDLFVCPACHGSLTWSESAAECGGCDRRFESIAGHAALVLDRVDDHDEEHLHADHKHRQAAFYDRVEAEEFEITRPHGAPALYGWLLEQKLRRSIAGLPPLAKGSTVLTVCAGSGMDAEFLARRGFTVIAADISRNAVLRTAERARRFGLPIVPLLADIERLPFDDASLDLVYVHDGLHHLEDPFRGLLEMARVGRMISITEPARAAATAAAVRLRVSQDREPAGNRVYRFTVRELAGELRRRDFQIVNSQRYVMYYRHQPGRVFRLLSTRPMLPAARMAHHLANGMIGHWGNKLTVQAVRRSLLSGA
jgi:ubiquinone/menaquinone biosynthesis C-methylase UbiE